MSDESSLSGNPQMPQFPQSDEEARRRRLDALSSLAQQQNIGQQESPTTQPSAPESVPTPPLRPQRISLAPPRSSRRRPLFTALAMLLVIIVIGGVILHQVGGTTTHHAMTPLSIAPSLGAQACLRDIAWSPNDKQIAVIGYRDQCPNDFPANYDYHAGVVHIYDATTGQLVKTILPDDTIAATPGFPSPGPVTPASTGGDTSKAVVDYGPAAWSPDGKQLALSFFIRRWKDTNGDELPGVIGIALVDADGANERAYLTQLTSTDESSPVMLNTGAGKLSVVSPTAQGRQFVSLSPGMSYSWSVDGTLTPSGSLTDATPPNTPVGNPSGGSSFTIWQPSIINLQTVGFANNQVQTVTPGAYTWSSGFLAWSPDGHYLVDSVDITGVIHPAGKPAPTVEGLKTLMFNQAPTIAMRDAAMQQAALSLQPNGGNNNEPSVDIAWRPDGRYLAALSEQISGSGNNASSPVMLYNTANGATAATLQPVANARVSTSDLTATNNVLNWSPDGKHLLCYNSLIGTITIWGPDMLPK